MNETKLGKIDSIRLGEGGYQDAMFGVSVTLAGKGWGVSDFRGTWGPSISAERAKWTEADRDRHFAEMVRWVADLMSTAKVREFSQLRGQPVEVSFEGNRLKSWRLLSEVL